jgi:hypothetical protein
MVGANIQFYATRLEQYGTSMAANSYAEYLDFVTIILLPFPMIFYLY